MKQKSATPERADLGQRPSRREFLFVDDLADAIAFVLQNVQARDLYSQGISHFNVGTGEDLAVKELAQVIAEVVGYDGELIYDRTSPTARRKSFWM